MAIKELLDRGWGKSIAVNQHEGKDGGAPIVIKITGDSAGFESAVDPTRPSNPKQWARIAVNAYREFKADRIVAEKNFGGDMVRAVLHTVDPNIPVQLVVASRGKAVRAEPVSALYGYERDGSWHKDQIARPRLGWGHRCGHPRPRARRRYRARAAANHRRAANPDIRRAPAASL